MAYDAVMKVGDLTLELPPEQYQPEFIKLGEFRRTVGGGIVDMDLNGYRLRAEIRGLTVTQIESIKKRAVLNKAIDYIDYVPIAEKGTQSRTVYEDLGSEVIDGETVYLYVPQYRIRVVQFIPTYQGGIINYSLVIEEV